MRFEGTSAYVATDDLKVAVHTNRAKAANLMTGRCDPKTPTNRRNQ
jgi:hypothetical protein